MAYLKIYFKINYCSFNKMVTHCSFEKVHFTEFMPDVIHALQQHNV